MAFVLTTSRTVLASCVLAGAIGSAAQAQAGDESDKKTGARPKASAGEMDVRVRASRRCR